MFEGIEGLELYCDVESALGRVMNNRAILKRLLGVYLKDPGVGPLLDAVRKDDTQEALSLAHKLKGVSANLSLTAVSRCAADIEAKLKTGKEIGESELKAFAGEFDKTAEYVSKLIDAL